MAKSRATNGSLLGSLPWTIAAVAVSMLPHVPYQVFWITAAFVLASAWRYSIEMRRALLPHVLIRAVLALACFLGVLATYETISGVGPGSALLAVMSAMKLLETRKRRDQYVLLFIAIFLTMSSLLREQYLWSLPYLIIALLITLTAWLRLSATSEETSRVSARTCSRMVLYAAPIAIAMWFFFPRIATPFWSVPIDTGSAVSGLSDRMSPGDISSLSLSNAVAFRVKFSGPPPAQKDLYWRGIVLTRFTGRSWDLAESWDNGNDPSAKDKIQPYGEPVSYEVTLEATSQRYAFALDIPLQWNLRDSYMTRHQQLMSEYPIDKRERYQVVSFPQYRLETELSTRAREWYSADPPGNPETVAFAKELRAQSTDNRDFVRRVLQNFSTQQFFYTLRPPALGANPVDQFMFRTRRGFCEHYASAFAVMMRAAGIPAKIILGYQGGEMNGEHMTIRQADAHAWTEIWLEGDGWVRVDPTAAVAPERIESGRMSALFNGIGANWGMATPSAMLYQISQTWDSLNAAWNDMVLGFGPDKQRSLMEKLGMEDPDWRKMMLSLVAIVAGIVLLISAIMMLRSRPPRRDAAFRYYQRFVRKTGLRAKVGETPESFADRAIAEGVNQEWVRRVTSAYLASRYGLSDAGELERLKTTIRSG